jgi:hypothetical protein
MWARTSVDRSRSVRPAYRATKSRSVRRTTTWLGRIKYVVLVAFGAYAVLALLWSYEPSNFDVRKNARDLVAGGEPVVGATSTAALERIALTLLAKPGGYLSNDVISPALFLDNVPGWEFGVIVQIRDFARTLRNDFSRSQSQSAEDSDLAVVDPKFSFDSESWIFPTTESEYREAIARLDNYLQRLQANEAHYFPRADNLEVYLGLVSKRLGNLAQHLSASSNSAVNAPFALPFPVPEDMDAAATGPEIEQTPWFRLDDVYYDARGATWALLHILKAVEIDFRAILDDKKALAGMRDVIKVLEHSQAPLYSPMILNGTGNGLLANHSLILASYVSRANSAIIDLRHLLRQG